MSHPLPAKTLLLATRNRRRPARIPFQLKRDPRIE
jgi:hypothetical protein